MSRIRFIDRWGNEAWGLDSGHQVHDAPVMPRTLATFSEDASPLQVEVERRRFVRRTAAYGMGGRTLAQWDMFIEDGANVDPGAAWSIDAYHDARGLSRMSDAWRDDDDIEARH